MWGSELTSQYDDLERWAYFIVFNAAYQNKTSYGILFELELATLTNEEIQLLHEKLPDFPPM